MSRIRNTILAVSIGLALLLPTAALAHKVSIFAYVDGKNIVVDAFYSKSNKVNHGSVAVQNAATGEEYARVTTDENGAASFPVPAKAVEAKADLRLLLVAGEGHQSDTLIKASEFAALAAKAAAPVKPEPKPAANAVTKDQSKDQNKSQAKSESSAAPAAAAGIDEAALSRIVSQAVDQAVESRMAPVKRMLMESAEKGPGPTEVVGGIGYIVGLFGVAAFVASRKKGGNGR